MLNRGQIIFLIQVLEAKSSQGQPLVSVGIEHAQLAADTYYELKSQLAKLTEPESASG